MNVDKRIKRKSLFGKWEDYGRVGEFTGELAYSNEIEGKRHRVCVGDVLSYTEYGKAFIGVVMKKDNESYGIMGRGVDHLNFRNLTLAVQYDEVPIEMINALHRGDYIFVEEEEEERKLSWREFRESIFELGLTTIDNEDGEKAVGHPICTNPLLLFNDEEEYRGSVTVKSINISLYSEKQIKEALLLVEDYLGG